MALVRRKAQLCALRALLLRRPDSGQCRGFRTSSVLGNSSNLEDIILKISSKGTQTKAAVSSLLGVGPTKPYRLTGEDSEWSETYTMKPLDRKLRRKQLWIECNKAWQMKTQVDGSVLNVVRGGYAVSIAGFVAFMPRSLRKTSNIHSKFYILNIRSDNNNLIVGEAEGNAMTWSKLFRFYKRSLQRLDLVVWIRGTVVSRTTGGYCVAIAGHIAFLPQQFRKSRKLETTFRIMTMHPRTGKIVVQEVNTKHFAALAAKAQEQKKLEEAAKQKAEQEEQDGVEQDGVEQDEDATS